MNRRRVCCVVGTRPEAIKMAPVVLALRDTDWAETRVLAAAQHREMLDHVLDLFGIVPDVDLNVMREDQTLPELTARLTTALNDALRAEQPDMVLSQGDTTTVFITALTCFYLGIPHGHVEAGLRTGNRRFPFPEEMNRALAGRLSDIHFAPTERARSNLLSEGISPGAIHVTGNTVIDALLATADKRVPVGVELDTSKRLILVTVHRRDNFGPPMIEICQALRALADRNPDVELLYPVHPNPNVKRVAKQELSGHPGIKLCPPLAYGQFVSAMAAAYMILTDSGGIQEEAPAIGKPVLVLRDETERPDVVDEGVVKLVGPHKGPILDAAQQLLDDEDVYRRMARGASPYGDGKAAGRIVSLIRSFLLA
ncbi:MAG: UDP-N-acetylglucosamine 2-epimerase (non-hydrolyzing) [Phycisphaerae bacterium]|nr:UDP-N-acetylglucosamine 2-epimerase (non-hydrolyzing) [Phycisphaerae bacterium]